MLSPAREFCLWFCTHGLYTWYFTIPRDEYCVSSSICNHKQCFCEHSYTYSFVDLWRNIYRRIAGLVGLCPFPFDKTFPPKFGPMNEQMLVCILGSPRMPPHHLFELQNQVNRYLFGRKNLTLFFPFTSANQQQYKSASVVPLF